MDEHFREQRQRVVEIDPQPVLRLLADHVEGDQKETGDAAQGIDAEIVLLCGFTGAHGIPPWLFTHGATLPEA